MKRTIGTLIHPDNLNVGSVYFLKHDLLGEAEVEYQGDKTFYIRGGLLTSGARRKSWGKNQAITFPHYEGLHIYEPAA